jgi:hypothetical protein
LMPFDGFPGHRSARYVGLVRDHDRDEAASFRG